MLDERRCLGILGVSDRASFEDVVRAYRKIVKAVHPDLNGGVGDVDRLRTVVEAYNFLKKRHWKIHQRSSPQSGINIFRILDSTFKIHVAVEIIEEDDVICHCMKDDKEFRFRIPKSTTLPTKATIRIGSETIVLNIYDEALNYDR